MSETKTTTKPLKEPNQKPLTHNKNPKTNSISRESNQNTMGACESSESKSKIPYQNIRAKLKQRKEEELKDKLFHLANTKRHIVRVRRLKGFNPTKLSHVIANQGESVEKDYEVLYPPIGQGQFAEVRKAIHKTTKIERAVKIINKKKCHPMELMVIRDEVSRFFKNFSTRFDI